jgi:malonyl-ACP decarboxylase
MSTPPVVVGMSLISPFGHGLGPFAAGLRAGRSAISVQPEGQFPRYRARLAECDLGTVLTGAPEELAKRSLQAARRAQPSVHSGIAVAVGGWLSARLWQRPTAADRIGLVVAGGDLDGGHAQSVHLEHAATPAAVPPRFALHMLTTHPIGVISQALGIHGCGLTIGLATAGGNAAVIAAALLLAAGDIDVCLVVAGPCEPSPVELAALANLGALAWDRPSTPFDQRHSGFVLGAAAACLVLETIGSARRRGVPATVRLAGYGQRLDGNSLADPNAGGESAAMTAALRSAGRKPEQVQYINAHGTGAPAGDLAEAAAITQVFGRCKPGPWVNSTKSLIGHCLGAAGVVEAVATVVQMTHGYLHPNAGLRAPISPRCRFVGAAARPARVTTALSNGFAFGGVNTSLVFTTEPGGRR